MLDQRQTWTRKGPKVEILIQWKGHEEKEATWELKGAVREAYLDLDLEDKISLKTGSTDTGSRFVLEDNSSASDVELIPARNGPMQAPPRPKQNYKKPARFQT